MFYLNRILMSNRPKFLMLCFLFIFFTRVIVSCLLSLFFTVSIIAVSTIATSYLDGAVVYTEMNLTVSQVSTYYTLYLLF